MMTPGFSSPPNVVRATEDGAVTVLLAIQVGEPREDLEFRQVHDLEWGDDAGDATLGNGYLGTAGGGLWEAQLTW